MNGMKSIEVEDLKARMDRGDELVILDVREPHEVAICALEGSIRIPLRSLPQELAQLSAEQEIVVHCKMGGRSAQAVGLLMRSGFSQVSNLTGGIKAWAERVDSAMARY